ERDIQQLQDMLRIARQKYSESHPDVQSLAGRLDIAKQKHDEIMKEEAAKKPEKAPQRVENPSLVKERREYEASIRDLDTVIEAKDLEIQNYQKELKRATEAVRSYQIRVESVPLGEKQYSEILRDREIAKTRYIEIEQKLQRAQVAREMENRKQGENLELLDPASLPITPTEPKRPLVISIGAGVGLLLGIVIAGAREMKDTALKN